MDFVLHPLLKSPFSKKIASFLLLLINDLITLNNNMWGMENSYIYIYIYLYILKQQWCLSVWAMPRRFFQSLPIPCGDKQGRGRAARAVVAGGRVRCHFY
jgi:hypothetical protein